MYIALCTPHFLRDRIRAEMEKKEQLESLTLDMSSTAYNDERGRCNIGIFETSSFICEDRQTLMHLLFSFLLAAASSSAASADSSSNRVSPRNVTFSAVEVGGGIDEDHNESELSTIDPSCKVVSDARCCFC